jgi:hypothetical protein
VLGALALGGGWQEPFGSDLFDGEQDPIDGLLVAVEPLGHLRKSVEARCLRTLGKVSSRDDEACRRDPFDLGKRLADDGYRPL